ncbi:MAG TPA: 2-oxo-4-hydroxy-4-carboxy-5-ureidoimidazoline decarboxylase [Pyrinomonadaceae bacterium]
MSEELHRLNALTDEEATAELLKCCAAREWARRMSAARPFLDEGELFAAADRIWWSLDDEDWLEAFRGHPKIGGRKAAAEVSAESARWSESEQRGTSEAAPQTLDALAHANQLYEEKFGFIYIVCATGKSAAQMLDMLNARLAHERDMELRIAAEEQRRITALRLNKLLNL